MTDKRLAQGERGPDGACPECGRRHKHADDCGVLKRRQPEDISGSLRSITWHPTTFTSSEG